MGNRKKHTHTHAIIPRDPQKEGHPGDRSRRILSLVVHGLQANAAADRKSTRERTPSPLRPSNPPQFLFCDTLTSFLLKVPGSRRIVSQRGVQTNTRHHYATELRKRAQTVATTDSLSVKKSHRRHRRYSHCTTITAAAAAAATTTTTRGPVPVSSFATRVTSASTNTIKRAPNSLHTGETA